jgi:ribonuclease E
MLINVSAGEECRIALLDDGKLQELYMERTSATSHVGNIYKGKVTNVEPSIQAAFVDFGIGRNGFLHISDLMPSYFGKRGSEAIEPVGRKLGRRDRPPIQQCLRKGDEIIVQIIKEGIGTKGPTLSSYLSVPGRVLVMMPGMSKMGISKKIEDEEERMRLRKILDGLKPPKDCGFIIRTAGIGKSKLEIERDLKYLARLWETLKKKIDKEKPPVELYTEGDLVTRTVRDVFTSDVDHITIDDKETARKVKDFIKLAMPRTKNKVNLYEDAVPLFHKADIEGEIESIYSRRVPLPSGGSLVIDQTEAIVAIDVNSGKFRDHSDAETTAFKTDMEAADEIPRQLKLRDMGGVIICDFIDLRFERHRREVEERLHKNLSNDRAKTRMLRMSHFGIIEMTRQRMRPSLKKSIYQECTACRAHGMVKTPESMALDVMRKLRIALNDTAVVRVQLAVHPDVALFLQNRKRAELAALENASSKRVIITSDATLPMDEMRFELFDARDGYIFIAELGMALPSTQGGQHRGGPPQRGGRDRGGDRSQQFKPKHDRQHEESEAIDADDLFSEDADEAPKKTKQAKVARTSAREAKESKDVIDGATDVAEGEAIEQTGNDDEASVVEIDEGGSELPGNAAEPFNDPREQRYNNNRNNRPQNRHRGGDRRPDDRRPDDRRPDDRRPDDRRPENRPVADRPPQENRGRDDRNRDDRNRNDRNRPDRNRDQRGGGNRPSENRQPDNRRQENRPQNDLPREVIDAEAGERMDENRQPVGEVGAGGERPQQNGEGQGGEGGRRRRRRRGRRGRGRGGDQGNNPGNGPQGEAGNNLAPQPQGGADDDDFADDDSDRPAPGNSINDPTSPQEQLALRDERAGGGGRNRRGGGRNQRGRGRGNNRPQPSFDRTGLPDDEELEREARALEEAQAAMSNLALARQPANAPDDDARGNERGNERGSERGNERDDDRGNDAGDDAGNRSEASAPAEAPPREAAPTTGRGSRGGRSRSVAKRVPPPMPDVVKTGSADKHLADDEPVDADTAYKRPETYADLDELPDYDE